MEDLAVYLRRAVQQRLARWLREPHAVAEGVAVQPERRQIPRPAATRAYREPGNPAQRLRSHQSDSSFDRHRSFPVRLRPENHGLRRADDSASGALSGAQLAAGGSTIASRLTATRVIDIENHSYFQLARGGSCVKSSQTGR